MSLKTLFHTYINKATTGYVILCIGIIISFALVQQNSSNIQREARHRSYQNCVVINKVKAIIKRNTINAAEILITVAAHARAEEPARTPAEEARNAKFTEEYRQRTRDSVKGLTKMDCRHFLSE